MRPIIEIDEANFETEVLKSSQPVLVEFATGWSLPSVMFDGAMDEIDTEFIEDLKLATVKLDRNPNLGLWYGIRCLPTECCISATAKCVSGSLEPRTKKQFFPN